MIRAPPEVDMRSREIGENPIKDHKVERKCNAAIRE